MSDLTDFKPTVEVIILSLAFELSLSRDSFHALLLHSAVLSESEQADLCQSHMTHARRVEQQLLLCFH